MSDRARGLMAISLMWLGFVGMYAGISSGADAWNVAGLAVAAAGVILVLVPRIR